MSGGPGLYRVKATVEAVRWNPADLMHAGEMIGWLQRNGAQFHHPSGTGETTTLAIQTPQGEMTAQPGDWVIKGVTGLFFVRAAAEFREGYELAPGTAGEATPAEVLAAEFDELTSKVVSRDAEDWDITLRTACDATAATLNDCAAKTRDVLVPAQAALTTDRDQARALAARLERVIAGHERSMYAALIDVTAGRHGVAKAILTEALDGFEGPKWNGTGTGLQWLERTQETGDGRG